MAETIKGLNVVIGSDTTSLSAALSDVNKNARNIQGELKQVERLLKFDPTNTELVAQKQKLLSEAINNSREKLDRLRAAQEQVNQQFAEGKINEGQYRAFQREVIKAEQELKRFEDRLGESEKALKDSGKEAEDFGNKLSGIGDKTRDIGEKLSVGVTAPIVGFAALATEGTKELRTELAKLDTNAQAVGADINDVNSKYREMVALTGELDSSTEGLSNLLASGFKGDALQRVLENVAGAAIKFKDTLKFEGIADGLQETLASGAAIGPFEELLSRLGVDLDAFNKGLEKAIINGTQHQFVLDVLAKQGLADVYEQYKLNNSALIESAKAHYDLQKAMADLGKEIEPIITQVTTKITALVNEFNKLTPEGKEAVLSITGVAIATGPLLFGVGKLISAFGALKKVLRTARTEQTALNLTMASNPIGLTVAAIGLAIGGMIAYNEYLDNAVDKTTGLTNEKLRLIEQYKNEKAIVDSTTASDAEKARAQSILNQVTDQYTGVVADICKAYGLEQIEIDKTTGKINENTAAVLNNIATKKAAAQADLAAAQERLKLAQQEANPPYNPGGPTLDDIAGNLLNPFDQSVAEATGFKYQENIRVANEQLKEAQKNVENVSAEFDIFADAIKRAEAASKSFAPVITSSIKGAGDKAKEAKDSYQEWEDATDKLSTSMRVLDAEMEIAMIAAEKQGGETQALAVKQEYLNQKIALQKQVVDELSAAYEESKDKKGKDAEETSKLTEASNNLYIKLAQEIKAQADLEKQVYETTKAQQKQVEAQKEQAQSLRDLAAEVTQVEQKYREDLASALDDYQSKVKDVNRQLEEDERRLTEQYQQELDNRANALSNFVGLFDEVTSRDVSGEDLLKNLRGQVDTFDDWQKNLADLAARGVDEGLIEELRKMGPKAAPEIAALNTLTDEQLKEYVALWQEKNEMAREEAVKQLEQQRAEMEQKLDEIRAAAAEQLEAYRAEWEKKNAEIRKNTEEEMKRIQDRFNEIAEAGTTYGVALMQNFTSGIESQFGRLRETLEEAAGIVDSYMPHSPAKRGPLSKIMEWGPALVDSLVDGIMARLPRLEGVMENLATLPSPREVAGAGVATYDYRNSGNQIHITVQDGEDLLRTLRRLGVKF